MTIIDAFIPIWALTAVGYLAQRSGLLGTEAASVLGRFVFHVAMPAALFITMSTTPLTSLAGRTLATFAISTIVIITAGWWGAGRLFDRKPAERPIWGMSAGYVNSANLGIPIAMQVLGNISFLAEVVLIQSLIVTPIILTALDRHTAGAGKVRLKRIATLPLRNPVMIASVLGVVWSATHLHVPSAVGGSLHLLAAAATPTALVALGASLYAPGRSVAAPAPREIAAIAGLKLIAQPLVAFGIGLLLQLSHEALLTVVVCAGLPTAQNTFIFAQEYGVAETLANRAVVVSTTLSLGTLAAAVALLGRS
jgi:malonate transporter